MATHRDPIVREQTEIEAAKTLLQLRDTDTADTSQDDEEPPADAPTHDAVEIDIPEENENLLPVDAPMQEDFAKDMAEAENATHPGANKHNADDIDNDEDDAATIIYDLDMPSTKNTPKKGTVTFKHYGIRRHSPRLANVRKHRCPLCDKSANSKKELNDHHRAEHEGVKCPTCHRIFPTADAYQRHRYVHRAPANFKCDVCGKILPFKSDLTRHLKSHVEDKKWLCAHPTCGKDFKHKADLDLHTVTHSGVKHKCTEPGCTFSSLDP